MSKHKKPIVLTILAIITLSGCIGQKCTRADLMDVSQRPEHFFEQSIAVHGTLIPEGPQSFRLDSDWWNVQRLIYRLYSLEDQNIYIRAFFHAKTGGYPDYHDKAIWADGWFDSYPKVGYLLDIKDFGVLEGEKECLGE